MAKLKLQIYLSYSQLCIFLSSLEHPFNDWSDRNFSQGFSWREGSVSFRSIEESGDHTINLFVDEPIPDLASNVVRAFKVPFKISDGNLEIASISDSSLIQVSAGEYSLQVEFIASANDCLPQVNIRLNKGVGSFFILKADDEIELNGELDLDALPAMN